MPNSSSTVVKTGKAPTAVVVLLVLCCDELIMHCSCRHVGTVKRRIVQEEQHGRHVHVSIPPQAPASHLTASRPSASAACGLRGCAAALPRACCPSHCLCLEAPCVEADPGRSISPTDASPPGPCPSTS